MAVWVGGVFWCFGQWSFPSSIPLMLFLCFFSLLQVLSSGSFFGSIFLRGRFFLLMREHARDGK
jgi:hypothetical protein